MGHYNWPRLDQMPTFGAERQFVCDFGNVCTCVYMCVGKAEKKKLVATITDMLNGKTLEFK